MSPQWKGLIAAVVICVLMLTLAWFDWDGPDDHE